ncbi:Ig domain protein [Leptospira sp. FAT2]|uniref:Ig domain protein n=1 Tax=Leptospira sanjuanensis TaxID=2879643 RepID=UPI001EE7E3D5|nr:Ig domain protein [Leptospira sanjuanensis]MCG6192081.1 Ig domain protein [Leptospira sanjuanensis]
MKKFLTTFTISLLLFTQACKNDPKDDETTNLMLLLALTTQTITYGANTVVFVKNVTNSLAPTITNPSSSDIVTISPSLTNSISIDSRSGRLSGSPTQSQTRVTYTANLNSGKATTKFDLIVENTAGSGRCNSSGIANGCGVAQPYSCADQPTTCFRDLSDCRKDSYCY